MKRAKKVEFRLVAPEAQAVSVAGSFNDWHPQRTPLQRDGDGAWSVKLSLPPGRYEYRFLIDGQWVNDPDAPEYIFNPHGSVNAVRMV